jgi:hypothetical protein
MDAFDRYSSVLGVFGAALVRAAGLAKKQLISKRPVPCGAKSASPSPKHGRQPRA